MSTPVGQNNAPANIGQINVADLDIETLLLTVQSQRTRMLDTQLSQQMDGVKARNDQIANLNNVLSSLNGALAKFPSDAKPDAKVDGKGVDVTGINKALEDASVKNLFDSAGGKISNSTTKGDLDKAVTALKGQIDNLNNSQQMDMLRLQSLTNKRNEAFDTMTNFIKKMQDSRSSIIGNMR